MPTPAESSRIRTPPPLRIVNWPLRDDGVWAWSTVAGMLALAVTAGIISGSVAMGLFAFAALAVSVWRLWIPVTFELGANGVVQTFFKKRTRIPWHLIARYEILSRGVLLSPDHERTPLAPLKSLYIRWNRQRDELLRVLEFFLAHEPSSQGTTQSFRA